ncbi:MAG: STAS domain-containing protein [Acidobacteriota bacterium]
MTTLHSIRKHDAIILHPAGALGIGKGVEKLKMAMDAALATTAREIVLDLSAVKYLDAAGLRELIACRRKALVNGRRLVLTGVHSLVEEILEVAQLRGAFDMVPRDRETLSEPETPLVLA